MKNLNDLINKNKELDPAERTYINQMLQDSDIQTFIDQNEIDEEFFQKELNTFLAYYQKKMLCQNCSGNLTECKQSRVGKVPVLVKDGEYLDLDYQLCDVLIKESKEASHNPYLHVYGTSFIDTEGEVYASVERAQVLKYITNFIKTYSNNPNQLGLYLYGSYGCGKSFLIGQMAKQLASQEIDVAYIFYPDFVRSLKQMITTGGINSVVEELKDMPIVIFDDFGGESNTDFIRDEFLLPILQYRMTLHKPIFITSNLSDKAILEHLSNGNRGNDYNKAVRVFERIKTLVTFMELKDKNYR